MPSACPALLATSRLGSGGSGKSALTSGGWSFCSPTRECSTACCPASSFLQGRLFGYGLNYKEARKAVTLTGMVPFHVQCIKTFLLLFCCDAQLGLTDIPYGFNLW